MGKFAICKFKQWNGKEWCHCCRLLLKPRRGFPTGPRYPLLAVQLEPAV